MNLDLLKIFREIVVAKSISKVSASNHISQSALSQNLKKLEEELGTQLLIRSNKGVEPTESGRILFKYSGTITRVVEKLYDELNDQLNATENIRITGYQSLIDYSLPCLMYKVKTKYPNFSFELRVADNKQVIADILDDITDIGFVSVKPSDDRFFTTRIGEEKIVLVCNSKLNIPDKIHITNLRQYKTVLLSNPSIMMFKNNMLNAKSTNQEGFKIKSEDLDIIFTVDSIPAAKSSVTNSNVICFLPYMSVKRELYDKRFKNIEIEGLTIGFDVYLVAKTSEMKGTVKNLFDYFAKNCENEFC